MTETQLLEAAHNLRRRTRARRQVDSVPLTALGAATLAVAVVDAAAGGAPATWIAWAVVGPLTLGATWWWYRRRERRTGLGTPARSFGRSAVVLTCAVLFLPVIAALGGVAAVLSLAVALLGLRERSTWVFGWSALAAAAHAAQAFSILSNVVHDVAGHYVVRATTWVTAVVGAVVLAAGVVAALRERATR